mmetsp:Transcript_25914/g.73749  ORF Transcript_25914/g.73749 Transcript_25914/m.73749 type:complete len:157 (-) Transcript_25914:270-740(-)
MAAMSRKSDTDLERLAALIGRNSTKSLGGVQKGPLISLILKAVLSSEELLGKLLAWDPALAPGDGVTDCPGSVRVELAHPGARPGEDLRPLPGWVAGRLESALSALSPHALLAMSTAYLPEFVDHDAAPAVVVQRLRRLLPKAMPSEAARRMGARR